MNFVFPIGFLLYSLRTLAVVVTIPLTCRNADLVGDKGEEYVVEEHREKGKQNVNHCHVHRHILAMKTLLPVVRGHDEAAGERKVDD